MNDDHTGYMPFPSPVRHFFRHFISSQMRDNLRDAGNTSGHIKAEALKNGDIVIGYSHIINL